MLQFLCETAEKQGINVNLTSVFTFIGMAFSIVVSVVALVWLTCFVVRLLIKTFKTQVQSSYDIFVENNQAKAKSKKERNAIKRQAKDARKMEILNMKEESRDRIHQMKVDKLGIKLNEDENKAREKYGFQVKNEEKETLGDKIRKQEDLEKIDVEASDAEKTEAVDEIKSTKKTKTNEK